MNVEILQQRADLLQRLRAFFRDRGFLEVETPLASTEAIPERHIGLYKVADLGLLQASPEMHHKRLLCAGSGPIFEVARSFRAGERGPRHNAEFTLVEWYRPGDGPAEAMELTGSLLVELLGAPPARRTSYRDAFIRSLGVDPHAAPISEFAAVAEASGIDTAGLIVDDDRDEWLNLLLSAAVEPSLGVEAPELLTHYPATQAALAATTVDEQGVEVAERFELYYRGVELANGYHELTDPVELRRRLEQANQQRVADSGEALPLPERLLADMGAPGLPPCAGVALGFDRLVMIATGAETIADVRPFADEA